MSKTKQREEFDHVTFIKDPVRWPCWPLLPVKKYTSQVSFPTVGLVFAIQGYSLHTVYETNMFDLCHDGDNMQEKLAKVTKHEYESVEAMVADGWIVD